MEFKVEYWDIKSESKVTETGFRYRDEKSVLVRVETWTGTKESIFKEFDNKNNSLKYCNGTHYKFEDKQIHKEYLDWYNSLSKATKFEMYYGKGIVD